MHTKLKKHLFDVPETWFGAFLFSFKIFTVGVALWLLVWHVWLSLQPASGIHNALDIVSENWADCDYNVIAFHMGFLYLLAAGVMAIGGLIQQFKYSPRAGLWSILFSGLALGMGIVLRDQFQPFPPEIYTTFYLS